MMVMLIVTMVVMMVDWNEANDYCYVEYNDVSWHYGRSEATIIYIMECVSTIMM